VSKEILGHITCPHCQNPHATVHRQAAGKKVLYYRCYEGENGDCGTVQIILAGGQKWINSHMRSLDKEQLSVAVEDAGQLAKENQQKAATAKPKTNPIPETPPVKKMGLLDMFFNE